MPALDAIGPFCELDAAFNLLLEQDGYTGTWSGPGVSGNQFDPGIGPGSYGVTFNPNAGTCASPASIVVVVTSAVTPNVLNPPSICETGPDYNLPVNVSGVDGTWSGPGVINNTFDPDAPATGAGAWTLTFTPGPGECATTASMVLTVNPAQDIALTSSTGPFCETDAPVPLAISPNVPGTWTGPGVSGNTFDPGAANTGANNITFTPSGSSCLTAAAYTFNIQVQSGTPVVLDPVGPFCILDGPAALPPTQNGVSGTWSGDGVSGGLFNPAVAGVGNTTLTFSPTGSGCTVPATTTVTVQAAQSYTPLPPPGGPFCQSNSTPVPLSTTFNGVSGTWSGPGVSGGNSFTPSAAGTGMITLSFNPVPGTCASSGSVTVEVQAEQVPVLDDLGGPYCSGDGPVPLPGSQNGLSGSWSGSGVVGGSFDPGQAAPGPNTLTFTPAPGLCAAPATTTVSVSAGPVANPPAGTVLVCIETVLPPVWTDNLATVTSQINGGSGQTVTWYLDAAGTNEIDPATYIPTAIASGTTQTIYATVTDGNGCESGTVAVLMEFEFTPDASPFTLTDCAAPGGTIDLTAYNNQVSPGNTVTWYLDAGGSTLVGNPTAYPAINGTVVWATASSGLCESAPAQVTFDLSPEPDISPIPPATACGSFILPAISGNNLTANAAYYSNPGGGGIQYNPGQVVTTSGTYYAYDSAAPGCSDEEAFLVTITPAPNIFPPTSPVTSCGPYTLPAINGTGLSGAEAYYTGPNGTGQQFMPGDQVSGSGVLFLYDGTPGCDDEEVLQILIEQPPAISPVSDVLACDAYTLPPIQGTGIGSSGFYYTGPGAAGSIYAAGQEISSSQLLYAYAGSPGCSDEQSFFVTIIDGVDIAPLPDQSACTAFTLPPIGGENLTTLAAYFTGPNGTGTSFAPGDIVTQSGTFYLFDDNTVCSDEVSFDLTISEAPVLSCAENTPASGLGNADGAGLVQITGGTAPFLVEWSGPASGDLSTSSTEVSIDDLPQGAYTVTVSDDSGCTATCTFAISAPDCTLDFDFDIQGANCPNSADGAASLSVTGGDGDYDYNWSTTAMDSSIAEVLPGPYSVTVTDGTGCQAEANIIIDTLSPAPGLSLASAADTICESGCTTLNLSFTGTSPFNLAYQGFSGTDSLLFEVFSTVPDTAVVFCPADSLLNAPGLIWQFGPLTDANCVASLDLMDTLVVLATPEDTLSETLCPGESLLVNGTLYDEDNPLGSDTLTGAAVSGCDSIVVVRLDFFPADTQFIAQTLCRGRNLIVNGTLYGENNPNGVEVIPNGSVNGCDSLIAIDLSFEDAVVTAISETLCPGESLMVNGIVYDAGNPTGTDTLFNGAASGCDSILTVLLDFYASDTNFISETLCTGSSLMVNGTVYDAGNPNGFEVIPGGTVNGCDSLVSINLGFEDAVINNIAETLCPGDSLLVNGTLYNENNTSGSDTLLNGSVNGCDSIINVAISYTVVDTQLIVQTLCPGDSLFVNGAAYHIASPSGTEVLPGAAVNGCDSVIRVELDFFPADTNRIAETLCAGASLTVNGTVYDAGNPNGFEVISGGTINGCDSLISIDLSFEEVVVTPISETLCPGESLVVNGTLYDANNPNGVDTLFGAAVNGCDSIIEVSLNFDTLSTDTLMETLCPGESLTVNGVVYDAANPTGTEVLEGAAQNGCDSTVHILLDFLLPDTTQLLQTLCAGDSLVVNGVVYDASNPSGLEVLPTAGMNGCDSLVRVDLSFEEAAEGVVALSLCEGAGVEVNGTIYDQNNPSGLEFLPGAADSGCDSLVIIDLVFQPAVTAELSGPASLCPGDSATLTINLSGADSYSFNLNDGNGIMEAFTGVDSLLEVTVAPTVPTTYTLTNLSGTANFCPAVLPGPLLIEVAGIEVATEAATTYNGFEVSCAGAVDGRVEVQATGGASPYTYQWSNGGTGSALDNLGEGLYTVTVTDAAGCLSEASVELTAPPSLLLEATAIDANCTQENSGQIIIDTVLGGVQPYRYQLNETVPIAIGSLPVVQTNLPAGNYELLLLDANSCQVSQPLLISPAAPLVLELGENKEIQLGESVQLSIVGQNFEIESFYWQPDTLNSLEPRVMPTETTTYSLTAQDANGCSAMDFITVIVGKGRRIYAPNIFSPNGDGSNDQFTLFAGSDVAGLNSFRIFDRWGEQVFEGAPQALNNELLGWDGNYRGEPMDPAVFVFYAEVEFIDGRVELIKGDFVLMR